MHQAAYNRHGLNYSYAAIQAGPSELDDALNHLVELGCRGANITVPNKLAARNWVQQNGSLTGKELGAFPRAGVNTVNLKTKQGISTDEPGFMATLPQIGICAPCRTLLLGAGGAAQALLLELKSQGWDVSVWNRTPSKWTDFLDEHSLESELLSEPDPEGFDLVINSTSTGLTGVSLGIDWSKAKSGVVAYDLAYTDGLTQFMQEAEDHGVRAVDGRRMLVEQGALSFEWWLGIPAPREDMLAAVK
jgi:shikimate dehydrogenase